jgi:glycosyltransferase involved in cell wall biosynthesis
MSAPTGVTVVIPAKDEADRVGRTVRTALQIPGVSAAVVVDDGSADDTAAVAEAAGARVLRHERNQGKAAAMTTGGMAAPPDHAVLFLDADLADTAGNAAPLVPPVLADEADMTIAILPGQRTPDGRPAGGRGLVVSLSRAGIQRATGWVATQPLSGQRCLSPEAFRAALPLAPGFGVETGLTIDLLRLGFRVLEVEVPLQHRASGHDLRSHLHRGRQWADVAQALRARRALLWRPARASARSGSSDGRPPGR